MMHEHASLSRWRQPARSRKLHGTLADRQTRRERWDRIWSRQHASRRYAGVELQQTIREERHGHRRWIGIAIAASLAVPVVLLLLLYLFG